MVWENISRVSHSQELPVCFTWLAALGAPIPRLVFVVDSPAAEERRALLRLWVMQHKLAVEADVLSPSGSRGTECRKDRLSQKLVIRDIC